MKQILFFIAFFIITNANCQKYSAPYLKKVGGKTELIVDDKPFLMLSGELHNSSTGSAAYMEPIWERMAQKNLNTVLAAVSWEMIEKKEGTFDFSLVDVMINGARKQNLKLILLWFGSWKNGLSTYTPLWVKNDYKRFPLIRNTEGETRNALSTFGENSLKSDTLAFSALMKHIKEVDQRDHTVISVQVENEIGVLASSRDYSAKANTAFNSKVPDELMNYLLKNKNSLHPALLKVWAANGYKKVGTWEEIFGKGEELDSKDWKTNFSFYTEELFMAWNYAKYVGEIAKQGKKQYSIPMYANAWLKKKGGRPGRYPSGGPLPHVFDIWRAGAPSIDFFAPDIYAVKEFDWMCEEFTKSGNPLFIPETTVDYEGAARAFYAFGKYHALGYSPFGIDGGGLLLTADPKDFSIQRAYNCLKNISSFILENRNTEKMTGLLLQQGEGSAKIEMADLDIVAERYSSKNTGDLVGVDASLKGEGNQSAAGLLIIKLADNEFLVAGGGGVMVKIAQNARNKSNVGYASVEEIIVENGKMQFHLLNGDETAFGGPIIPVGDFKAFKIKVYEYEK
ncbi:mannonate dehydratase [Flavobacterium sufflavum]|uniref:Mannonate dehydratase n=1 Tax=Flavobacterium sufflavum TaxID=1921138 RepID=A0A3S2USN3_9FLAO|nr:DUF5597 domain-containing protein [Flavobacterium sufflavum]RVT79661.1 mannonate dehydratase [Flavobacterium sufflavum]